MDLTTHISELSGIGKTRAAALAKMGVSTVKDLVYYFPRAYEYRADVRLLGSYNYETPASYVLTVATKVSTARMRGRLNMSKFRAFDESGSVEIVFFNSPYVKDVFHIGDVFRFYGKPTFFKAKRLNLINPKYEPVRDGVALEDFVPIYSLTDGMTSKSLDKIIRAAMSECLMHIVDHLPDEVRIKNNLPTLTYALRNIHLPESAPALQNAKRRLAFDEMLLFALGISLSLSNRKKSYAHPFAPCSLQPLIDLLPYELTGAQKRAINDIYRDTVIKKEDGRTPSMARIIVGDVGSGKTICAIAAIYIAKCSGYQSALMVPTEILANQHYADIERLLGALGLRVSLLTGSTTQKAKREIYQGIADGSIDVVIGTHALITDKVTFGNLGLIITDEQHRFGVAQRAVLKDKANSAHMLVMSATPIPRTLALALYGDLDISKIDEMPKGRIRVDTFVVNEGYRSRLNAFIEKQVALGGQCYIVCPSIEAGDKDEYGVIMDGMSSDVLTPTNSLNLKNAVEHAADLRKALPHIRIECLHGKMKASEKDEIMARFVAGDTDVLVSTTVIEVGVNVPNASLMVVENAERFGLSQLHQLRGRVGRGNRKSYCILVSDINAGTAKSRLEVMRTTYDGFEIADKDLMLRGPGDFFSHNNGDNFRQSGGFEFKLATNCDDHALFEAAFSAAKGIAATDPTLSLPEHKILREMVNSAIAPVSTIS